MRDVEGELNSVFLLIQDEQFYSFFRVGMRVSGFRVSGSTQFPRAGTRVGVDAGSVLIVLLRVREGLRRPRRAPSGATSVAGIPSQPRSSVRSDLILISHRFQFLRILEKL